MTTRSLTTSRLAVSAAMLLTGGAAHAQESAGSQPAAPPGREARPFTGDEPVPASEEIIVTGTRRTDRTVTESAVPIDVFTPADLTRQGTSDMNQVLQNLVPSFSVGRYAISDASTFVRPPNLRGLPPDETLVLVNGKRRHRSAVVQLGGGALSEGSQSADLAQIPAIAIERVEVLRDGASAQYGSDAIAGVLNFGLKNNDSGITGYARYGQYYEGDGEDYQVAANVGLPLGEGGFLSVSGEYVNSGPTHRGATRPGALALQQAFPELDVPNPAQRWGNPDLEAERIFVNGGFDLGESDLYFFGNYGHSYAEESFNYRQSVTVTGPNQSGTGTQTFNRSNVFEPIYLTPLGNGNYDATGETFSFAEIYPGGFTPWFYGKIDDISGAAGYRGETGFGLRYDLSASYGQNRIKFYLTNTMNPSLGPDSPTEFYDGSLEQRETNFNLDLSYPLEVGLASPITIAGGAERRRESYELGLGDIASWQVGPYARQVVQNPDGTTFVATQPIGSNGFPGYGPEIAGEASQTSYAGYLDIEGDVTDRFSLGVAVRYEHFSSFGGTTNVKGQARYEFSDAFAVRGSASTGFRAPTPGQINTSSIATTFNPGDPNPVELATLPVTNPAAIYFGAQELSPEEAVNLTAGLVLTPASGASLTVDYYNIKVTSRIGTSQAFEVSDADRPALQSLGVENYATLGQVQFLTNAFDTRTQGVDVVGSYLLNTDTFGTFNTTLAYNYNKTEVIEFDPSAISNDRVLNIENQLPKHRVVLTENWNMGPLSVLVRGNYYDKFQVTSSNDLSQWFDSEFVFDVELTYEINENFSATVGAQNILDNYPERDVRGGVYAATGGLFAGNIYPDQSPFGFNGGFWYARLGVTF